MSDNALIASCICLFVSQARTLGHCRGFASHSPIYIVLELLHSQEDNDGIANVVRSLL